MAWLSDDLNIFWLDSSLFFTIESMANKYLKKKNHKCDNLFMEKIEV